MGGIILDMEPIKIFIPVFSEGLHQIKFRMGGGNPGIGGTDFVAIRLAQMLASNFLDLEVGLVSSEDIQFDDPNVRISNHLYPDIDSFLDGGEWRTDRSLVLIFASLLEQSTSDIDSELARKLVAWFHFPYQLNERVRELGCGAHVHIGRFQFESNSFFYPRNVLIHNLFDVDEVVSHKRFPDHTETVKIVYLGALVEVKGFGYVARAWESLKQVFDSVELHVIGSSSIHGETTQNPDIPTNDKFARDILAIIPIDDIRDGLVTFHGNPGLDRFELVSQAHFAILNPTGASEAFPASVLECMSLGTPVIASDEFGMFDFMRFFPELSLQSTNEIAERAKWLMADKYRWGEFVRRSEATGAWYKLQTGATLYRWRRLFDALLDDKGESNLKQLSEVERLSIHRGKLLFRRAKAIEWRWRRGLRAKLAVWASNTPRS